MTITVRALSTSRMGMPKMGLRWIGARGGVGDVVRADDQGHIGLRKIAVDVVHFDQLVVGDVRFGEQHVHVAGHASGDGMNAELHVDAFFGENVVEFADFVLRLRDGHAVSGNDDHFVGGGKNRRGFFRAWRFFTGALFFRARGARPALGQSAPKSTLVKERFMALHMMTERMKPEAPSSAPATTSTLLLSTKPRSAAEKPA